MSSGGARAGVWRTIMRVGILRRLYAKRLLAFMAKSKRKRRPLPNELRELDIAMGRLPEHERRAALERALAGDGGGKGAPQMGRDMRRAASRQSRQSGRGGSSNRRPGAMRTRDTGPQAGQNGRPRGGRPR